MKLPRPKFEDFTSGADFEQWYWLKEELVQLCKEANISYVGNKKELTERLAYCIDHPDQEPPKAKVKRSKSNFNWAKETLTPQTLITDSYKNGPNVRKFFKSQLGDRFAFNIDFMKWMRENTGKTLADAVTAYVKIKEERKSKGTQIPASNQYNKYMRDFFQDNPDKSIEDARKCWKLKRSLPGKHIYERTDLDLV